MAAQSPAPKGGPQAGAIRWLICFAVKEEAAGFNSPVPPQGSTAVVVTGMGAGNAARGIRDALERWQPQRVITAGFAGGLNPAWTCGQVVHDSDDELGIGARLQALGAVPVRFHCATRIATTAADKTRLRNDTGADVVEMESGIVRAACRSAGVPSATIRVISDAAHEDLPLDFNAIMTPTDHINWWKFARTLAGRPTIIGRLLAFQKQTRMAARALGTVLEAIVKPL